VARQFDGRGELGYGEAHRVARRGFMRSRRARCLTRAELEKGGVAEEHYAGGAHGGAAAVRLLLRHGCCWRKSEEEDEWAAGRRPDQG
jgi:hypothetical protein